MAKGGRIMDSLDTFDNFEYSREWYENTYGGHLPHKEEPKPENFHFDRDLACLKDAEIDKEDKILVCGCGGGNNQWTVIKKLRCLDVWGTDWSQKAVEFFNRQQDIYKQDLLHVRTGRAIRADCTQLPFNDGIFDVVLAMDITEHIPFETYLLYLANCYRVLRNGGKIVLLPGMTNRSEHINVLPMNTIVDHMQRIGFHIFKVKQEWAIGIKQQTSIYNEEA